MRSEAGFLRLLLTLTVALLAASAAASQVSAPPEDQAALDARVRSFLESRRTQWRDENVTAADGAFLKDFIIKHGYTRALEIGTSTGHSGIWMAWALSRTGGKLVTIEIDEGRYEKARANFRAAGLEGYVDARLGDAHELVPLLEGPFDFVFVDADKDWYQNYFKMLLPKILPGGCFAAHNVRNLEFMHGVKEFLDYARSLPDVETTIERSSASGISLSFKKKRP
jgi:caffeoyl-CoA O-methyltransferase